MSRFSIESPPVVGDKFRLVHSDFSTTKLGYTNPSRNIPSRYFGEEYKVRNVTGLDNPGGPCVTFLTDGDKQIWWAGFDMMERLEGPW